MKLKVISILTLITLIFTSCEKFLDVNQDVNNPAESMPNFLLPPVLANLSVSHFDHGECNSYFTQQVATLRGYDKYKDRWDYVDANRIAQWRRHYHDVSVNALNIINSANLEGSKNYEAIGRICFVISFQQATDIFGDMPYEQAFQGNPSPKYDSQEFIYGKLLEEIDLALQNIADINPETVRKCTSAQDILYGGDMLKWKQLALAVKARLLLHLTPNVNQDYQTVINAVNEALNGWYDAGYDYSKYDNETEVLQKNQWGPSQSDPGWDYANNILDVSAPSEFSLLQVLKYDITTDSVTDPRQPLLMKPRFNNGTKNVYLYVVPTEGKDATKLDAQYPDLYGSYVTQDRAVQLWFTEEELHFIKAEAAFNAGDKSTAFQSFQAGIRANMKRAGVLTADAETFLTGTTVPHNATELTLSHIMMQKYLALWLQGEVWADMRRYNYDSEIYKGLKRPRYLVYYWDANNPNEWIERLPYDTETEELYNKPTLEVLGAYQNPEWLKKPMWWAK